VRVAQISTDCGALPFALRLQDEGNDVRVYFATGEYKGKYEEKHHIGEGLIPIERNYEALIDWAKEGDLAGEPTLIYFDDSGWGKAADELRHQGLNVVGGGVFADRLEKDRRFGQDVAKEAGCALPPHEDFSTLTEAASLVKGLVSKRAKDQGLYFKSDRRITLDDTHGSDGPEDMLEYIEGLADRAPNRTSGLIQAKIDGTAISTAQWWNGRMFIGPITGSIEHKALMNDDVGPATGCSLNAVWYYPEENPDMAKLLHWENLAGIFREHDASPGIYDINAIVDKQGNAYFLEWTPRNGFDSQPLELLLIRDYGAALWAVATRQGGTEVNVRDIGYSIKLGIPPYPWFHADNMDRHTCIGTELRNDHEFAMMQEFMPYGMRKGTHHLEASEADGQIGITCAVAPKLSIAHKNAVATAKRMKMKGLMYRTDGATRIAEDAKALRAAGVQTPKGLEE
jgi:phosphoribosylamine-glycine ligase